MTPPPPPPGAPEARARVEIDAALEAAGWIVQDRDELNLSAATGVAVREFKLQHGHGFADYLLFVNGKAVGVLEAKPAGHPLIGVEPQAAKYSQGLPSGLNPPVTPLPFLYLSTGAITKLMNLLDPEPRSRRIFHIHRPETLAEWIAAPTLDAWVKDNGASTAADDTRPSTLRARLRAMPELEPGQLYPNQILAIKNLEQSLRRDKPRALLQMATGSGKTLTSIAAIYKIRTRITEGGSTIEAEDGTMIGLRDRRTRTTRSETPDEAVSYAAGDLDRNVVAIDQIRLIVRTFRDKVLQETFGDRKEVPKTLVFAKDDSHAEDIVGIFREEFGRGNDFCTKITYKTTGKKPKELIQDFRTGYHPRVVVTVDLIATGTDIRPIEIVMFMRSVKRRVLFEQMKGRGVRVIDPNELRAVTPDARAKTHFLIVDCVGVTESELVDTQPLERQKHVALRTILEHVAMGGTDPAALSSLASRLSRLDKQCGPDELERVQAAGGTTLQGISHAIVAALEPDRQVSAARTAFKIPAGQEPSEGQVKQVAEVLMKAAVEPLATRPGLRQLVQDLKKQLEQIIDEVSQDELLAGQTGLSAAARDKARGLVVSFETFLQEHRDEITALQFFFSVPHRDHLHFRDIKELVKAITAPPRSWTPDRLWRAYELLDKDKVRGASGARLLTDIVSLVRFALHRDNELVPHADRVRARFESWMAQQANTGRKFSPEQAAWLQMIRDHIAASWEIEMDDFDDVPFIQEGGLGRALQVFGKDLPALIQQLNEAVAA